MAKKEVPIAKTGDLKDGEMKQVSFDGNDLLLVRIGNEFHAFGAYCTHYGAELATGVLHGDRIVCPWHHACFNAKTGDLMEPPALDALPCYDVRVEGESILLQTPDEFSEARTPTMAKHSAQRDARTFAIIGAGAAGNAAAQTLREDGFEGRIVMVTQEDRFPYDRPNLSKDYLQGAAEAEWMPLRGEEFYEEYGIEVMRKTLVTGIDNRSRTIAFANGSRMEYDALLVASGGKPSQLPVPGANLEHVFTLRSYDDSDRIIEACEGAKNAVVIGASFIGMESACSLRQRELAVTVVAPEAVPFEQILGREVGALFQEEHERNGVTFNLGQSVSSFKGDGRVDEVVLTNGEHLAADVVVAGVGVKPATAFLSDFNLHSDGSVKVDPHLRASENVFAAGDIASFPDWRTGGLTRIEHWRTAQQQGRIAAHNMAGKEVPYRSVPFFWTVQFDLYLRYVGHVVGWDKVIFRGDPSSRNFIAFYLKQGKVLAAAGCQRDRELAAFEEMMRIDRIPSVDKLKDDSVDLHQLLR